MKISSVNMIYFFQIVPLHQESIFQTHLILISQVESLNHINLIVNSFYRAYIDPAFLKVQKSSVNRCKLENKQKLSLTTHLKEYRSILIQICNKVMSSCFVYASNMFMIYSFQGLNIYTSGQKKWDIIFKLKHFRNNSK